MRYTTLYDLRLAYLSGALTDADPLVVDNDSSHVKKYAVPAVEDDDGEEVYEGPGPEELLMEALALLGIPATGA